MTKLTQEQINSIKNAKTIDEARSAYDEIVNPALKVFINWTKPKGDKNE